MNSRKRFARWWKSSSGKGSTGQIWGLFDPMSHQSKSAIFLTEHGKWQNEITLAHELAHWLYTHRCLALPYGKTTESFARDFDASYESFMRRAGGIR